MLSSRMFRNLCEQQPSMLYEPPCGLSSWSRQEKGYDVLIHRLQRSHDTQIVLQFHRHYLLCERLKDPGPSRNMI